MNKILDFLEVRRSKKEVIRFVQYIGDDQKKFDELISYCFGKDEKLAERAAWPIGYCVEMNPKFIMKHFRKVLTELTRPRHNAIHRSFTRLMQFIEVPKKYHAETISICFELLNKKEDFIAAKVFSMTQLGKFCKIYPELKEELKASIESQFSVQTAAFRSRGMKVLRDIEKISQVKR